MRTHGERGAASIYVTLLLAFVLFGFMVMAFDLGRMYVVQGEIQTAADAAALAAATRLVGTANSALHATDEVTTAFDTTSGNDNRFNLHLNKIGSTDSSLFSEIVTDYFATLADAQANVNGGQTGADAKYVRVQINVQAPVVFARFLGSNRTSLQPVSVAAIAGTSAPVCSACGIDPLAVTALDSTDENDYGFSPGAYYTLYLTVSQQQPNLPACRARLPALLTDTIARAEYTILNHTPTGPSLGLDATLFEMGAAGVSTVPGLDVPGCVAIGSVETAMTTTGTLTCSTTAGRDVICGMNTRFGVDPTSNQCTNINGGDISDLAALYASDTDLNASAVTTLQDYPTEYDGNQRRVITVAIVDAASTLTVLNFRQFLIENAPNVPGLDPSAIPGALRAQYIGHPAAIRAGAMGGACTVSAGVGRVLLF